MLNVKYTDSFNFRCLENLRETSLDVSLIHTGREHCKPYHIFSGVRDEYIIHLVLSGSGFYSARGKTYSLGPGQMFLIYPGEAVTYGADEATPWTYAWIGFNGMRADAIIKQCGFSHNTLVLPTPDPEVFMPCITDMLEHKALTFANDLYREAALLQMLSILVEHHTALSQKDNPDKYLYSTGVYVQLAIDYIQCMYMHGIKVADIAENIGISRAHLNHAFQKEVGVSIQKFLIDYRMHKAANMLVSTGLSVKEVSSQVGYEDQLTFSKAFKKKFGISPRDYRSHKDTMDKFSEKQ